MVDAYWSSSSLQFPISVLDWYLGPPWRCCLVKVCMVAPLLLFQKSRRAQRALWSHVRLELTVTQLCTQPDALSSPPGDFVERQNVDTPHVSMIAKDVQHKLNSRS